MNMHTKVLGIALLGAMMGQAQAGVVFSFTQSGGNVVMNTSGVLDVSKLDAVAVAGWGGVGVETNAGPESDIMGDTTMGGLNQAYRFNVGTDHTPWIGSMFTSSNFGWSSAGTTQFATYAFVGMRIPGIAIDTADLVGNLWTPDNSWSKAGTLASLGLTPGSYTITDSRSQEFITIQIGDGGGANDVPEPATLALLGLGLAGAGLVRRKRQA